MRKTAQSFGHAVDGLCHAIARERNLRMFFIGFLLVLLAALYVDLPILEFTLLIMAGLLFMATELINTALERLVDAVDECRDKGHGPGYHHGLKATKDVASAAALVVLLMNVCVITVAFWPFVASKIY